AATARAEPKRRAIILPTFPSPVLRLLLRAVPAAFTALSRTVRPVHGWVRRAGARRPVGLRGPRFPLRVPRGQRSDERGGGLIPARAALDHDQRPGEAPEGQPRPAPRIA